MQRKREKISTMPNETEWEDTVKKKIRYMTNHVWDGINFTDVENFISNFESNEQIVGWALLDMLIYYSNEQEESIITNLMRLLKRDIWLKKGMAKRELSSADIKNEFIEIYKSMCFVPVDESDVSASSFSLTSQFKKSEDVSRQVKYIRLEEVPLMMALQNKYFVFYDDIIGTGNQFKKFWERRIFGDPKNISFSISDLVKKNPDKNFYYLVLGGCQEGMDLIKNDIPNLNVIVSEIFPKSTDVFSEENEYWELNPDKKDLVLNYVSQKEKELEIKSAFSKNLPVLFQHSRASNTALSLYWSTKPNKWKELYKR